MANEERIRAAQERAAAKAGNVPAKIEVATPASATASPAVGIPTPPNQPTNPPETGATAQIPATDIKTVPTPPPGQSDSILDTLLAPPPIETPPPPPAEPAKPTDDKEINFANLRKIKETIEKERDALRQKVSQIYDETGNVKPDFLKTLKVEISDVEVLKKERDAALDLVAKVDLQRDPRWQAKYASSENAAKQAIVRIAKEYEIEESKVSEALAMPLKQRIQFFNENLPEAVAIVAPFVARLDEIKIQKEADIANAREIRGQMDGQQTVAREKAISEARQALHSEGCRQLEQAGVLAFKTYPGNETWNNGVEGAKQRYMELMSSNDAHVQSIALGQAAALPVYAMLLEMATKQINELRTKLDLHSNARATIQTGNGQTPPAQIDAGSLDPQALAKLAVQGIRNRKSA